MDVKNTLSNLGGWTFAAFANYNWHMKQELTDMTGTFYCGGGATQNSIRFAQWMLQTPGATSDMGCVGKDKFADTLKESMDKAGCKVR